MSRRKRKNKRNNERKREMKKINKYLEMNKKKKNEASRGKRGKIRE